MARNSCFAMAANRFAACRVQQVQRKECNTNAPSIIKVSQTFDALRPDRQSSAAPHEV